MERNHLSKEQRNFIVTLHQRGFRQSEISDILGKSKSVISRIISHYRETGSASRRPGSGSVRATNDREDRHIRIDVSRAPFSTARRLQQGLQNATGKRVSDQTVRNRLKEAGIKSYRPLRRIAITANHRRLRLAWANERIEENFIWDDVLFTDESRFCLHNDSRRKRVYRSVNTRNLPAHIQPIYKFGGGGVMVWAGVALGFRTELHCFDDTLTGQIYRDEIITPYVTGARDRIGPNFVFLDDNARPHRARVVMEEINNLELTHLPLPPYSPDLNPIEHVWDRLQYQLDQHLPQPENIAQLRQLLPILWQLVSQEHIDNIIRSMPQRCHEVVQSRGHPTRY